MSGDKDPFPDGEYEVEITMTDGSLLVASWQSANPVRTSRHAAPLQPNFIQIKRGNYDWDIYSISHIKSAKIRFIEESG